MSRMVTLFPPDVKVRLPTFVAGMAGMVITSALGVALLAGMLSYHRTAPLLAAGMALSTIVPWQMRRYDPLRRANCRGASVAVGEVCGHRVHEATFRSGVAAKWKGVRDATHPDGHCGLHRLGRGGGGARACGGAERERARAAQAPRTATSPPPTVTYKSGTGTERVEHGELIVDVDVERKKLHAQHHPHAVLETRRIPGKVEPPMKSLEDFALPKGKLEVINPGPGEFVHVMEGQRHGYLLVALAMAGADRGIGGRAPADTGPASALRLATGAAPTADRCPLTADQVSSALGSRVKGPDSSCSFFPADESKASPNATYVKQLALICSGNNAAEDGYTEKVDGLGPQAYIADRADGSWLLVCRSGAPFEIRVDAPGTPGAARAAAMALARQVLAAR